MTIYRLKSDLVNYSFFIETGKKYDDKFHIQHWNWKTLDIKNQYEYKICASDTGKKTYQFDISAHSSNYIILSERAVVILKPILEPYGDFFEIITPSKRKKFIGYYPYKNVYPHDIINIEKSDVGYYDNGTYQIYHPVLYSGKHENDPLFVVDDLSLFIFANEKFKQLVEQHDLKGFDFSEIIPVED